MHIAESLSLCLYIDQITTLCSTNRYNYTNTNTCKHGRYINNISKCPPLWVIHFNLRFFYSKEMNFRETRILHRASSHLLLCYHLLVSISLLHNSRAIILKQTLEDRTDRWLL